MPESYNIDLIRKQFPALAQSSNGKPWVFFDNPGGTQVPQRVIDAISRCLVESNANLGGAFITSQRADAVVVEAHQAMADFLNAKSPAEIIFGQNSTTLTFHMSRTLGQLFKPGDEIILTTMEHDANVTPWELLARDLSLEIKRLPFNTENFEFDLSKLDDLISDKTRLLCINHSSNMLGTINDIKAAVEIAHNHGVLVYVDSVQYAPHGPLDVQDLGCDFLMCSPYKFFGPHMGVLWARSEILEDLKPYKLRATVNQAPDCYELGTLSHEAMCGVTAAVDHFAWIGSELASDKHREHWQQFSGRRQMVHAAMNYLFEYEMALTKRLIAGLQQISSIRVQGITDPAAMKRRVPTISFTIKGMDPESLAVHLASKNIFVWHGHNYAIEPAKALDIYDSGSVLRVGLAHYNTEQEVDLALQEIRNHTQ